MAPQQPSSPALLLPTREEEGNLREGPSRYCSSPLS